MIVACRQRDFAQVFRLARRAGIHNAAIARRVGLTVSRVGEVMSGSRTLRDMSVIERVADGLRIPGHMLGLAPRSWESGGLGRADGSAPPAHHPRLPVPSTDVDGVLSAAFGQRCGRSTVHALRSCIQDYWRRDEEHGGAVLRPAMLGHLRYATQLIADDAGPYRPDLHEIAAELAVLIGWTHFDDRQYHQARTYFTEAAHLARSAGDRLLLADVLSCMSLQATYEDRPRDAVAFATAARDCARSHGATPRVTSILALREAYAHACLGDRTATHAQLSQAQKRFSDIRTTDDDPTWAAYFDESKLIADTGIALGRLGEAATAEPLVAEAVRRAAPGNHRTLAFHSFWLARLQLRRGNLDEACRTATAALGPAGAIGSERLVGHFQELRKDLAPHRKEPAVTAFASALQAAFR
ncbi:hypothetical protein K7I03_17850 [Streptomyces mobaraensis]|nr:MULTISPECIES: hypothetical protein [Streptomyces]UBI41156.1 hypothetical protein K7I03_17850 [Streptomyces mobaraensis]UKW33650.1 hypothetical protein MCU78_17805 [Streptomyces sp. TYQ1024]